MKKNYFLLFMLLVSNPAFAGYITVVGKVKAINNWEGHGGPLIQMADMSSISGLCTRNDNYILQNNHQYLRENYSLLLSARMSGQAIQIRVSDDAVNKCVENFPRIFHVYF